MKLTKITTKIIAALMAAITLLGLFSVTVGAESIADTAKETESGKKYSTTIVGGKSADYKIVLSKKEMLRLNSIGKLKMLGYIFTMQTE